MGKRKPKKQPPFEPESLPAPPAPTVPHEQWIPERPFDSADYLSRVAVPTYEDAPEEEPEDVPEGG